jgi:hypothetical protein
MRGKRRSVWLVASFVLVVSGLAAFIVLEDSSGDRGLKVATPRDAQQPSVSAAAVSPGLPAQPTDISAPGIPNDQQLLRTQELPGIKGEKVLVKWYGEPSFGVRYTANLTVGSGAGTRWKGEESERAEELTSAAEQVGRTVEPPRHVQIQGSDAIVYTDMNGWLSVSWSPRSDVVLSVTGWNVAPAQITDIAQGVTVQ